MTFRRQNRVQNQVQNRVLAEAASQARTIYGVRMPPNPEADADRQAAQIAAAFLVNFKDIPS